jgi:hypothetical protein
MDTGEVTEKTRRQRRLFVLDARRKERIFSEKSTLKYRDSERLARSLLGGRKVNADTVRLPTETTSSLKSIPPTPVHFEVREQKHNVSSNFDEKYGGLALDQDHIDFGVMKENCVYTAELVVQMYRGEKGEPMKAFIPNMLTIFTVRPKIVGSFDGVVARNIEVGFVVPAVVTERTRSFKTLHRQLDLHPSLKELPNPVRPASWLYFFVSLMHPLTAESTAPLTRWVGDRRHTPPLKGVCLDPPPYCARGMWTWWCEA